MFPMRSRCFVMVRANKFKYLASNLLAPKAEVTGSNPVGCANFFKYLSDKSTAVILPFPDYFRITCSAQVLTTNHRSSFMFNGMHEIEPIAFRQSQVESAECCWSNY